MQPRESLSSSGLENNVDRKRLRRADRLGAVITSLPKWTALAFIAWQVRLSIEVGGKGLSSLLTRLDKNTSYWELVCWFAAFVGLLYGVYNRILFRRYKSDASSRVTRGETT